MNTTEPKVRDAYGSLIDNPNYIQTVTPTSQQQMATNDAAVRAASTAAAIGTNTANAGTPAGTYKDITFAPGEDPALTAARQAQGSFAQTQANQSVNEAEIRRQALANFQGEIDATNSVFADKLARAKVEGAGRLGQSGAIQARRGLLGSDFGAAQTNVVSSANEGIYGSIENERNAAVLALQEKARLAGDTSLADKTKAKSEGLDAYVKYLADANARKTTNATEAANALIAASISPDQVNPSMLTDVAGKYGITTDAIKAAYTKLKEEKDAADKALALSQGKTTAETAKLVADTAQISKKFEEDKRQYGLDYALKAREVAAKEMDARTSAAKVLGDKKTPSSPQEQSNHLQFLKNVVDKAIALAPASGRSGLRSGAESLLYGTTDYTQLGQYADTLKTNLLTLATDPDIKKFFGPQMSNADVRLMQSAATVMSNTSDPTVLADELSRVKGLFERLQKATGIEPNDITQLPKEKVQSMANSNSTTASVDVGPSSSQINYQGKVYNVDANGDMTLAK